MCGWFRGVTGDGDVKVLARSWLVFLALTIAGLGLVACTESLSWKQKIIVTVLTPNGEVSGHAVQSISYTKATSAPVGITPGSESKIDAEAVVVPLPNGRYLFALLKGANFRGSVEHILQSIIAPKQGARTLKVLQLAASQPFGKKHIANGRTLPLLVTFEDITDPASVKRVDPENLAATFGQGYALKSITLEITDEPVTSGQVEKVLGWWCDYRKPYRRLSGKSGPIADNSLPNNLGPGAFRIGDCS